MTMKMSVKKGDTVLVISGRDKGKRGVIEKVIPGKNRIVVAGVNIRKHHLKPSKSQPRGGIIEQPGSIDRSNVLVVDAASEKAVRSSKRATKSSK